VMASDYAMPRFRMLPRLLLVHGHWNYARIAQLIEYFFYKNALFILLIFIYQGFSGWSGANFIPDLYLILFMLLFNSIPPIINATLGESYLISKFSCAILDRFLPASLLLKEPSLYQYCAENKSYQPYLFWIAMLDSILQASVQFFIPYGIFFDTNQFANESTISVWTFGTIVAAGYEI
jgi:phospholipid-translocating ATPase